MENTKKGNPCDECLVRVVCSALCAKAMSYGINKHSMAVLERQLNRLKEGRKGYGEEWVQLGKDLEKYERGNK